MEDNESGKAYYKRRKLAVFALYLDPKLYETLKRFAAEDDRSLQKTLNRIIADYVRERLLRELKKPPL